MLGRLALMHGTRVFPGFKSQRACLFSLTGTCCCWCCSELLAPLQTRSPVALPTVASVTMVIASSSKNKRKGDDSDVSSLSSSFSRSVSVFSPRNPNNASHYSSTSNSSNTSLMACKTRLQSIRELCQEQPENNSNNQDITAIMSHIATMRTQTLPQTVTAQLERADTIQRALRDRISATQQKLQNESQQAALRRQHYEKLVRHGQFLQTHTAGLEQQCRQLRHEIGLYQENLVSEQEYLELVQQQRQHQVPRLQQQISLYATMTGIKWDFEAQEKEGDDAPVLVGQVNIPSQNTIRSFQINRQEHTRFQVANYLWNMMKGEYADNDAMNSV